MNKLEIMQEARRLITELDSLLLEGRISPLQRDARFDLIKVETRVKLEKLLNSK